MHRRDFVKTLGLLPIAGMNANLALAARPEANYGNTLILIELQGGNDGLNTVVPYADGDYYRLRPNIAISRDQVIPLSESAGLHPALAPLTALWDARELAVIQGVGYAQPNLSHFRSIEIWDTASKSTEYLTAGWLARTFEHAPTPKTFAADGVVVGSPGLGPLAGAARAISLANPEQFKRQAGLAGADGRSTNPALAHILNVESTISEAVAKLGGNPLFQTPFPSSVFGRAISSACQVIAAQGGVAVAHLTLNGFDTHSNQPGTQARLLKELGEGLASLKSALTEINRWDSTLVVTYAEFGRRPQENLSKGTDHGTANTHFLLGGKVKGGLYGEPPRLDKLDGNGNLAYAVDFRSLYATALEKWWGVPARDVLGERFALLDVLRV